MKTLSLLALTVVFGFFAGLEASAQTDVRPAPGGKRLLFIDGDDIRPEPGGKRLLFVDGDDIRPEPGGKRLLFIDADGDVRPAPGGIRLATWDGSTLRRTPGGEILMFIDGDDIRPRMGGPRLYFLDGPVPNRETITAVLYLLKPELFTLSAEQTAAKQKEMADNGAASDAAAAADPWPGTHQIAGQNTTSTTKRTGSIVLAKRAGAYTVLYETGENPKWAGIGVAVNVPGSGPELWAAVGPAGATALGIYDIKGGNLTGSWIPSNAADDKSVLGFENLAGAAQLGGVYKITSGKLPNGGASYTGALNIDPLPATFSGTAKCYRIRWANGATAVGFRVGDKLVMAAGWGADMEVLRFRAENASFSVDLLNKGGAEGEYTLLK